MRWISPSDDANVVRLLETWRRAASALGQEELASALEIQTVVAKKRDDWDAVLAAFQATPVPLEALFSDWRLDAAARSGGNALRLGQDAGRHDRARPEPMFQARDRCSSGQ